MSNMSKELIRVGEIAIQTGKSARAIRFYEERGLLKPQGRTPAGYRLYSHDAVTRIEWIEKMQSMGLSISEISDVLLSLRDHETGPHLMAAIRQFYAKQLAHTQEEIAKLSRLSTQIQTTLNFFNDCNGCQSINSPHHCKSCQERPTPEPMPSMVSVLVE